MQKMDLTNIPEDIDFNIVKERLQKIADGDMVDVANVLQDIRKTIEFAVEFAGQQIYVSKDIVRELKYIEMKIEFIK
ncbi:MAG TPA: hypothetical protein PK771_10835, partial [Spirochaetota bacterium]|nr:hypothetical protein [Spirochaetota bacterium]